MALINNATETVTDTTAVEVTEVKSADKVEKSSSTYVCKGCGETHKKGFNFRQHREVKTASGYAVAEPFVYWTICPPCGRKALNNLAGI